MVNPADRKIGRYAVAARAWLDSILDPSRLRSIHGYSFFPKDLLRYRGLEGAEPIHLAHTQPCLRDKTDTTPCDAHYFYQDVWAFRRIFANRTQCHVDIGSRVDFVGMLIAVTRVVFVDICPLKVSAGGFNRLQAQSFSCRSQTALYRLYPVCTLPNILVWAAMAILSIRTGPAKQPGSWPGCLRRLEVSTSLFRLAGHVRVSMLTAFILQRRSFLSSKA